MTVNGVDVTGSVRLEQVDVYRPGAIPSFTLYQVGGALADFPSWDEKSVTLTLNGTQVFSGDTGRSFTAPDPALGWTRRWTCQGLAARANFIPVTDSNTLSDVCIFNQSDVNSPDYLPSRAGRSVGQIVVEVLEMPEISAELAAVGLINYTSAGTGAVATAALSSGSVLSCSIVDGGSGYTTAPTVLFSGGGGTGATGTATVSGGVVTGITITSGGSGYLSPPIVVLSRLPSVTLADLDYMAFIPNTTVSISGERILQALEDFVRIYYPNHWSRVDPSGNLRFHHSPSFANPIALNLDDPSTPIDLPALTRDWSGCATRIRVRGKARTVPVTLRLSTGDLQEDFAHHGLTNSEAKAAWTAADWNKPGQTWGQATANASVSSGAVSTITVTNQGYGYSSAPTVSITGTGTGATATANLTSGKVTSITVTSGGSGYTSATVTITAPGVGQSDIGSCTCPSTTTVEVTSANARANWPANYFDQSDTGAHGYVTLAASTLTDVTQYFSANIIANTALTPGGTSTLTLDAPLPSLAYDSYQIFGVGGGAGNVWRKYQITNLDIARRVQPYFPKGVPYRNNANTMATLTTSRAGTVFYSATGLAPFQQISDDIESVDPDSGAIYFRKPTALVFSSNSTTTVVPSDVEAFLPVNIGVLEVAYPPDVAGVPQYGGTAYTELGIERTKTVTLDSWTDFGNYTNMAVFAQELFKSYCDVVIEGEIVYHGLLDAALTPGSYINIAAADSAYVTGWESINVPVVGCAVQFNHQPDKQFYTTILTISNRRALYSAQVFERPPVTGQMLGTANGFFSSLTGAVDNGDYLSVSAQHTPTLSFGSQPPVPALPDFSAPVGGTRDVGTSPTRSRPTLDREKQQRIKEQEPRLRKAAKDKAATFNQNDAKKKAETQRRIQQKEEERLKDVRALGDTTLQPLAGDEDYIPNLGKKKRKRGGK